MLAILARGYALGLGAAVPIGPVNVELARRTLRGGFRQGFALGAGAITVDVFYATLTCFSLRPLLVRREVQIPLAVAGIGFLCWLGIACLRSAITAVRSPACLDAAQETRSLRSGYVTGLFMTLLNPMTLAFWFLVVPATVGSSQAAQLPLVCLGVFLGALTWVVSFAGSLWYLRRFRQGWWMAAADTLGGVILLGFAVAAAVSLLRR